MPFNHRPTPDLEQTINRNPLLVAPDTSLINAIALMSQVGGRCILPDSNPALDSGGLDEARASCVLVMEGQQLVGLFTERDVVRLAAAGMSLEKAKFCCDLVEELQISIDSNHQIIQWNYGVDCLSNAGKYMNACMDKKLLRQILTNLLSNAVKYSPHSNTVYFELACEDGAAVFQIRDEGIGISPEDQQRLFESFHRGQNVGNIPGTGLGLAIVKKCVEIHNGQIAVTSVVGVGTTFTVKIPLISSSVDD